MRAQFVALGLLVALLAVGCGSPAKPAAPAPVAPVSSVPQPAAPAAEPEAGTVGSVAPELQGKAWLTADGKAPDLKNKVYLVDFWSTT